MIFEKDAHSYLKKNMARSTMATYVWLISLLNRRGKMTLDEISHAWENSSLSYGKELARSTFNYCRNAIQETLGIAIVWDKKSKTYSLRQSFNSSDAVKDWLIDSFTTLNQLSMNRDIEKRIMFEDVPSGREYLADMIEAMKNNDVLDITYEGFYSEDGAKRYTFKPYGMRIFRSRWYVVGAKENNDFIFSLCLDRIIELKPTGRKFVLPKGFSLKGYYRGCAGVIADSKVPIEHIVLRVRKLPTVSYLVSLPLHQSQQFKKNKDGSYDFSYDVRPTFDFLQSIMMLGDEVEVVSPEYVRADICEKAKDVVNLYEGMQATKK